MKSIAEKKLPVHSLSMQGSPVFVRDIQYKNPYDFTREHRHDYFEIFFFNKGGGSQLIDFLELQVLSNSCYIVYPQQVHLLKRAPASTGRLVQFREEVLPSSRIKILLRQVSFGENPTVIFEKNPGKIKKMKVLLDLLQETASAQSELSNEISLHHLQALLLQLLDNRETILKGVQTDERKLLFEFQHLLEDQYLQNHSVKKYASELGTTEKKLAAATNKFLGHSPLQVIHNRLLLEAKRILLFENASHKEIAFQLGFDSPASFSLFIKNKTGFTPSELFTQLVNIHK